MAISPPRRDTLAVIPVIDYEPLPRAIEQCRQLPVLASRTKRAAHRRSGAMPPAAVMPPALRAAASFADAALRRVLEVVDRRRPPAQLRLLLTASLVDSVLSVNRTMASHDGAAVLRRVRLQPVGPHQPLAAEVFGTYSRGHRIHAIACRVEQVPTADGRRWQVVALHIG